jgi:small nuclear ribonucleoprotein
MSGDTFKVLADYLNTQVLVRLKGGRTVKGILKSYDQHLNLILADAEEVDSKSGNTRPLGLLMVRGDNVVFISPAPQQP